MDLKKLKKSELMDLVNNQKTTLDNLLKEIKEYKTELNNLREENKKILESRLDTDFDELTQNKIDYLDKQYKRTKEKKYLIKKQKIIEKWKN